MNAPANPVLELFTRPAPTCADIPPHSVCTAASTCNARCAPASRRRRAVGALLAEALRSLVPDWPSNRGLPALGGVIIGYEVARALGARAIFTERDPSGHIDPPARFLPPAGEATVVVEDVVTTGGTPQVVECLAANGARVLAAAPSSTQRRSRRGRSARVSLATLNVVTYPPDQCPLCSKASR